MNALSVAVAYLLGSLSGSLLIGRLRGVDIRGLGSGNAGGTNALRTQGLWFALGVVVIDVGKGAFAVIAVPALAGGSAAWWLPAACGFAAIVGHMYPVYFGFRGGKGVATFVGALMVLAPSVLLGVIATWVLVLLASGYVGLSSMLAVVAALPLSWWLIEHPGALIGFTAASAALIVFAHRGNIARLIRGEENRFEKARILHWLKRRDG